MLAAKIALQHKQWEELANLDPLYAIFTDQAKRFSGWKEEQFFAAGEAEVDTLMKARHFKKGDNGRALDFGCGVGRLTEPLRAYFGEVWGVDISESMIERARQHAPCCRFLVSRTDDLSSFANDFFDFVYSNVVLEHQPSHAIARRYIEEFVRIVKPGGIAFFQMPDKLTLRGALQPGRRLYSLLRGCGVPARFAYNRLRLNPVRTISLPSRDVIRTVTGPGGKVLRVYLSEGFNRHTTSYVVTKKSATSR